MDIEWETVKKCRSNPLGRNDSPVKNPVGQKPHRVRDYDDIIIVVNIIFWGIMSIFQCYVTWYLGNKLWQKCHFGGDSIYQVEMN